MAQRRKTRGGRRGRGRFPMYGTIAPTMVQTSSQRDIAISSFGTMVSSLSYGQLLTDFKTGGTNHQRVKLQRVVVTALPIQSANTKATMDTIVPCASLGVLWVDPTSSDEEVNAVMLAPFKTLSITNPVTISGVVPPSGVGWQLTDSTSFALRLRIVVPTFTTAWAVIVVVKCHWLISRDDTANLV